MNGDYYFIYANRMGGTWNVMRLSDKGNMPICVKQCYTPGEAKAFLKLLEG